jgi:Tn3 transposase DDE domain
MRPARATPSLAPSFFTASARIRDRSFENQRNRASGLNLVTAAIVLWNTVYLERAITALRRHQQIDDALLASVAPLGWNHVTGDYRWQGDKRVAKGQLRQLRRPRR